MYIILGANGQLGKEFCKYFSDSGISISNPNYVIPYFGNIMDFDLDDYVYRRNLTNENDIVVINCASYNKLENTDPTSAMSPAELGEERNNCIKTNSLYVKNLAINCKKHKAKLIHFSTDYVFGEKEISNLDYLMKHKKYGHEDIYSANEFVDVKPNFPENQTTFYGYSKLLGEKYIEKYGDDHLIIRTTSLYGDGKRNFINKILTKYKNNEPISLDDEYYCSPTYTKDLVKQTLRLNDYNKIGLYHVCNKGYSSWLQYAKYVFNKLGLPEKYIIQSLYRPINRPRYATLEMAMLNIEKINVMRDAKEALDEYLLEYKSKLLDNLIVTQ